MRVFSKNEERFGLAVSVFFILASLLQLFSTTFVVKQPELVYWQAISSMIFLDTAHIVLSFALLLFVPELRSWLSLKSKSSYSFLIIPGLAILVFLGMHWLRLQNTSGIGVKIAIEVFVITFPVFHAIRQNYGIAILYDRRNSADVSNSVTFKQMQRNERWIFSILNVLAVCCMSMLVLNYSRVLSDQFFGTVKVVFALVFVVFAAYLFCTNYFRRDSGGRHKALYLVRMFLHPLGFLTPIGLIGCTSMHGVEYAMIARKMVLKSKISVSLIVFASVFTILLWSMFLLGSRHGLSAIPEVKQVFKDTFGVPATLGSFNIILMSSLTLFHIVMDGFLFRFKDPTTRVQVTPLLQ
jgi:hypothetical protein